MSARLLIICILLLGVTFVGEYIAYASFRYVGIIKSTHMKAFLMTIGIIMPTIFIGTMLYGYKHYTIINSWLNTISSVWLSYMMYVLMASLIVFVIIMLNYHFNFNIPVKLISYILITIVFAFIIYGLINAHNPRIIRWDVNSEKLSKDWAGKKIVMISDVHLGTIRGERFLKRVIGKIDTEKPDVVFILGDLIDGPVIPYEKWLKNFDTLKPEFGNIYIEGNHEKYNKEYSKFKSQIPDSLNNITNKKIIINNTQIIGLDYHHNASNADIDNELKSLGYDPSQQSIVLVHEPRKIKEFALDGVSLILSGHTHNGQSFPWTIVINSIYKKYAHGVTYTGDTASVTGAGVGTALLMTRIGTIPEIVVLNIK